MVETAMEITLTALLTCLEVLISGHPALLSLWRTWAPRLQWSCLLASHCPRARSPWPGCVLGSGRKARLVSHYTPASCTPPVRPWGGCLQGSHPFVLPVSSPPCPVPWALL